MTKTRLEEQFISSQAFHRTTGGRVRETTAGERFRPRIFETFDPVALQHIRDSTCNKSITARAEKGNHARSRTK
jgi:hypothetical protein